MYNNVTMSERTLPLPTEGKDSSALSTLSGWQLRALRISWIVLAAAALAIILTSLPAYAGKFSGQLFHTPAEQMTRSRSYMAVASGIASLASASLSFGLGLLLFRRRFQEPIAAALSFYLVIYSVVMAGPWEHWESLWLPDHSIAFVLQGLLTAVPTFGLFALFPNGQIKPRWMRWVLLASIPFSLALVLLGPIEESIDQLTLILLAISFTLLMLLSIYGQYQRYQHLSSPLERQQTKWVLFGFSLWFGYMLLSSFPYYYLTSLPAGSQVPWWAGVSELGWWLSLGILPASLTIAITRYRLWNIDIVINRSLVYGGLAIVLVGLYLVIIAGLGLLFQASDSLIIPLIATGIAILVFQPLRIRIQAGVNRIMYGDRDEPAAVLARMSERLEDTASPQGTLTGIVDTVGSALKLPFVAIELGQEGTVVARYGQPTETSHRLPLIHQAEVIGYLLLSPRVHDDGFSIKDLELLETIASQASVVAYNAYLTADLMQTRQRLVTLREEERRRIRRDLHDGLGPQLASLSLKLEAAENLLNSKPERAVELIGESKSQVKDAVADIRRLVYNLRPPALDELGLISALRERAHTYSGEHGMTVHIEGPARLDNLPAAVEVAAYRITQEAINNADRHGQAANCWVRLDRGDGLSIEIEDDGIGMPMEVQAGVGILSMRERTEELGGQISIGPRKPTGTQIRVNLPIENEIGS